jgi:hypothetical protein
MPLHDFPLLPEVSGVTPRKKAVTLETVGRDISLVGTSVLVLELVLCIIASK